MRFLVLLSFFTLLCNLHTSVEFRSSSEVGFKSFEELGNYKRKTKNKEEIEKRFERKYAIGSTKVNEEWKMYLDLRYNL